ncbi:unnamed protein product [Camellia sinensis]
MQMAFRGRGRGGYGRGGGGSFGYAKQEPFLLFPLTVIELQVLLVARDNLQGEIENLPDAKSVTEEMALVLRSSRLQKFWNSSVYYLKDEGHKGDEITDIERFSDRGKRRTEHKHKLTDFIKCSVEYVPAELAQDSKSELNGPRKVRWNQESDLLKLDIFEKREQKHQGQDAKDGKEKKDDENEEEDDERLEEEDEEFSDDGDYNQNIDFDDDEDDFNMDDGNDEHHVSHTRDTRCFIRRHILE